MMMIHLIPCLVSLLLMMMPSLSMAWHNQFSYAGFKFVEVTEDPDHRHGHTFADAVKACGEVNGSLPSVHSDVDRIFLTRHWFSSDQDSGWLGGMKVNGRWIWLDGTYTDYLGHNLEWDKCEQSTTDGQSSCLARFGRKGITACDEAHCDKDNNRIICVVPLPGYPFHEKAALNHPLFPYWNRDANGNGRTSINRQSSFTSTNNNNGVSQTVVSSN